MRLKIFALLLVGLATSCSSNPLTMFQEDADLIRLEHLEYWTEIVDRYYEVKGNYPFQVEGSDDISLVKIATKQQMSYMSAGGENYNSKLDNNSTGFFKEHGVKEFVAELESVLKVEIDEKYDIQKAPTKSPVGYYYFASKDGYLIWVTCITCGVTKISTLLYDGITPTVNIVSKGMEGMVTKALTREDMLNHPTYRKWRGRKLHKGEHVRSIVQQNIRDSKSP